MLAIGPFDGPCPIYFQVPHARYWRPLRGDSPRGGEMSRSDRGDGALFALDAERPEGWLPATNLTPMGWFPTQGLKINRTTAMYTQKNLFPNNPP